MSESADDVIRRYMKIALNNMWKQFVAQYPPSGFAIQDESATVDWSVIQDPNSWTIPDLPPEPEWQYVEDFAGHKLYRREWQDSEEWTSNVADPYHNVLRPPTSRLELRRSILRNRDLPVHRAADGGLVGWRYWTLETWTRASASDDYTGWGPPVLDPTLRSPHRGTTWDGPTLSAVEWSDEAACEGHAGIHASLRPETLQGTLCFSAMPVVTGRVRGYGRYVLGTRGWRAERVVIDYLRVPADIFDAVKGPLSDRYACEVRKQWR